MTGESLSKGKKATYSEIFGQTVTELAEKDDKVVAITASHARRNRIAGFCPAFSRPLF